MRFESFIFDLYGTLADICTDENPAVFWEGAAADAEGFGAQYPGEALRMDYLRLCADEVRRRNAEEPEVPEEIKEPKVPEEFAYFEEYRTALGVETIINHVGDCFD